MKKKKYEDTSMDARMRQILTEQGAIKKRGAGRPKKRK